MKLKVLMTAMTLVLSAFGAEVVLAGNGDLIVNGNIGAGTSTPREKVDVNGNVVISGSVNAGTVNAGTVNAGSATVTDNAKINGSMVVDGNLGVGTATPTKKLHVEGDAHISGTISGATYGYGGMYSTSSCYGCRSKNPFTGGCSCPPGFTAQWLQQFPEGNCGWYTGNMYVCNK